MSETGDSWYGWWVGVLRRHRVMVALGLVIIGGFFSWMSRGIVWNADVLQFFAGDSAEVRAVRQAGSEAGIATQLRLDVHNSSQEPGGGARNGRDEQLKAGARALGVALEKSREFRIVWTGVRAVEIAGRYARLAERAPALLNDEERKAFEESVSRDDVRRRFAEVKRRMGDPDGEILLRQLAADPLGVAVRLTEKLAGLSPVTSDRVSIEDGMLLARDGGENTHVMIVAEPWALPSDQAGAERVMEAVERSIAEVKSGNPGIEVWVVGAHRGYVENARAVRRDVRLVSWLGVLAVVTVVGIYFRSIRAAVVCVVPPFVGMGMAMGVAGMFGMTLPLILLGFAGLLCGSTTDFGIQILGECRRLAREGGWRREIPVMAARRTAGAISMSVATSVMGFLALGLSDSPGLRAMGAFVALGTVCIWGVTILILPVYLGHWALAGELVKTGSREGTKDHKEIHELRDEGSKRRWTFRLGVLGFFLITAFLGRAALGVGFSRDPRGLDGSSAVVRAEEDAFSRVWGDLRGRAIVLVHGGTAEEALATLGRVHEMLLDQRRDGMITGEISVAELLPSDVVARERSAVWEAWWTAERREKLRGWLAEAAAENGFKAEMFAEYADRVAKVATRGAAERVMDSPAGLFPGLIQRNKEETTLATIVALNGARSLRMGNVWATELRMRFPEVTILSGNLLIFDAAERARAEGERLGPWCVLAILAPLWIYFRRLRSAWLVMVCLLVGLAWVLGVAEILGGGLNPLALLPILFTLGVAVDYGIYAASDPAWRTADKRGGNRLPATFMCALTTVVGSGSLVFGSHPAMRWLGMTLVAGVVGGYLTSIFVVTPLTRRRFLREGRERKDGRWRHVAGMIRVVPGVVLGGLTVLLAAPVVIDWMQAHEKPTGVGAPAMHPAARQTGARTFVAGDSWMRWRAANDTVRSGIWELMLSGTAEDRGYATAKLAGSVDVRIESEMFEQLDLFLPAAWSRYAVVKGMGANLLNLGSYIKPEYQQEIYWAGAFYGDPFEYRAPTYPRLLSYHALHDVSQMLIDNPLIVPNTFACTGVLSLPEYSAGKGGHLMMARNFDFEGGESFGRQKSVTYVIPPVAEGIPFAHVAWPGLAGAVTGMNKEKIALFINAAATEDFRRIGTPTILMARDVLQHANSIAEAEAIIQGTEVFVSDIIMVADGKTGQARIFEKSPKSVASYDVAGSAVVTNHLVTPRFADDRVNTERKKEGTTLQRYARARQLLDRMEHQVTPEGLATLLRDKNGLDDKPLGLGNRNAVDGLIACHAVVMDVTAGRMWVGAWPYAEGAFVGIDVMGMLEQGSGQVNFTGQSPMGIEEDSMMGAGSGHASSGWERLLASRAATAHYVALMKNQDMNQVWLDEIMATAKEVIRNNPEFYLGYELKGRVLLMRGERVEAKTAFSQALKRDPPYAQRRLAIEQEIKSCEER